jgi:hypothetical protein
MKSNYITVVVLLFSINVFSQGFEWVQHIGGTGHKYVNKSVMDDSDNVYLAGYFFGEADFDTSENNSVIFNTTDSNNIKAYVSKYNNVGDLEWATVIESSNIVYANTLSIDNNGIYVAGQFIENVDFDSGTTVLTSSISSGFKMFVAFYDLNGNFQWVVDWTSSTAKTTPKDLLLDSQGNLHITGSYYEGILKPDPISDIDSYSSTRQKGFWITLNNLHEYVQSKQFGDIANTWYNYDDVDNAILDESGNILISGNFRGSFDFDFGSGTTLLENDNGGSFFAKYTLGGTLIWAKQLERVETQKIACDDDGNIFATGTYGGNVDFDPSDASEYFVQAFGTYYDNYLLKWDSLGNFNWAFGFGGNYGPSDRSYDIELDANTVYITGSITFAGDIDFDPDPIDEYNITTYGFADYFAARYSTDGDFIWAVNLNGDQASSSNVTGKSIMLNNEGKLLSVGEFSDMVSFNSGTSSEIISAQGTQDIFLMQLDNELLGINDENLDPDFSVYPNPVTNDLFIKTKSLAQSISVYNMKGQQVYFKAQNDIESIINLSSLASGVYLLKVSYAQGLIGLKRIIKN